MKDFLLTLLHVAVMAAKLRGTGGVRSVIAENLLQAPTHRASSWSPRAPSLTLSDRLLCGFGALFLSPGRIRKVAIALRPSTLLAFLGHLTFSSIVASPDALGEEDVIDASVFPFRFAPSFADAIVSGDG
jgi:hypothetical protein